MNKFILLLPLFCASLAYAENKPFDNSICIQHNNGVKECKKMESRTLPVIIEDYNGKTIGTTKVTPPGDIYKYKNKSGQWVYADNLPKDKITHAEKLDMNSPKMTNKFSIY